jgi:hypothetical protein
MSKYIVEKEDVCGGYLHFERKLPHPGHYSADFGCFFGSFAFRARSLFSRKRINAASSAISVSSSASFVNVSGLI